MTQPGKLRRIGVLAALFVSAQLYVGFRQIESWPLSHGPMFSRAQRQVVERRIEMVDRYGTVHDLHPSAFNLRRPELRRATRSALRNRDPEQVRDFCRGLLESYRSHRGSPESPTRLSIFREISSVGESDREGEIVEVCRCELLRDDSGEVRVVPRMPWTLEPAERVRDEPSDVVATGTRIAAADHNGIFIRRKRGSSTRFDYALRFGESGRYFLWLRLYGVDGGAEPVHVGFDGLALTAGGSGLVPEADPEWVGGTPDGRPDRFIVEVVEPGTYDLHLWISGGASPVEALFLAAGEDLRPEMRGGSP